MIALTRQRITSACATWCQRHDEGPLHNSLLHISEHITWANQDGTEIDVWMDMLEHPDGLDAPRVQADGLGTFTTMSLVDARVLADAFNELIAATEAPA